VTNSIAVSHQNRRNQSTFEEIFRSKLVTHLRLASWTQKRRSSFRLPWSEPHHLLFRKPKELVDTLFEPLESVSQHKVHSLIRIYNPQFLLATLESFPSSCRVTRSVSLPKSSISLRGNRWRRGVLRSRVLLRARHEFRS